MLLPALALGVWYWLLHGRHRRWTRGQASAAGDDDQTERTRPTSNHHAKVVRIVRANPRATWRTVRDRTGLTDANAKRALTAARKELLAASGQMQGSDGLDPRSAGTNGRSS